MGAVAFEEVDYVDLDEKEMLQALKEFLPMLSLPFASWMQYSPLQQEFKASLHPLHLDAYHTLDVPCDTYLNSDKFC